MQDKQLSIQQFCDLQGCDDYTKKAVCMFHSKDTATKTYKDWYELVKTEFVIGKEIDFTPAPVVDAPKEEAAK